MRSESLDYYNYHFFFFFWLFLDVKLTKKKRHGVCGK